MFKNLALCLILLFSFNSIALTNEEKARKLYVEANLDLEKNCPNYFTILDTISDSAMGFNFNSIKRDYNLNKINDLFEYQNKIEDSLSCYNFIKNNFLPVIDEIQTDYSTTQVAYDLINSQIGTIKLSIDHILSSLKKEKKLIKLKIEANKAEIEKEKKLIKIKIEAIRTEIQKENNRIINCYTNLGVRYERKKIEGCDEGDTTYNPIGLTISEMDILRQQLRSCWITPAGAVIEPGMFVKISAEYNEDAKVNENSLTVVETNISLYNPFYDPIINGAKRTFYNPECETLKLPLDKYDSWKNITINFDFEFMRE